MRVNKNGIIVMPLPTHNKQLPNKHNKQQSQQIAILNKRFVTLFKQACDETNKYLMQPFEKDEVEKLQEEGWQIEEIFESRNGN